MPDPFDPTDDPRARLALAAPYSAKPRRLPWLLAGWAFAAGIATATFVEIKSNRARINQLNEQVASAKSEGLGNAERLQITINDLRRQAISLNEQRQQQHEAIQKHTQSQSQSQPKPAETLPQ